MNDTVLASQPIRMVFTFSVNSLSLDHFKNEISEMEQDMIE